MSGKRSGFGSVEQLPSGKWHARYEVEGQIFTAPRTFHNKTNAQLFLSDQELELARSTWRAPTRTMKTVESYGTQWIKQNTTGSRIPPASCAYVTRSPNALFPTLVTCD